jgi:DNA-binding transcriptional ArsR family regulator
VRYDPNGGEVSAARQDALSLPIGEFEIARLAREFVLDCVNLVAGAIDADHVSTLLFMATLHANIRHITHDPDLAERLGGQAPPDSERRPVSLYSLARTYHLSYETARRHLHKLIDSGLVERAQDQGLIVPTRALMGSEVTDVVNRNEIRTRRFFRQLNGADAESKLLPLSTGTMRRQISRLTTEYFLTFLRISSEAVSHDLVTTLVFLALLQAITEQHPVMGGTNPVPTASVFAAARQLSLPYETARRHVAKLIAAGLCAKAPDGKIRLSSDLKSHPQSDDYLGATIVETCRLAANLTQAGMDLELRT